MPLNDLVAPQAIIPALKVNSKKQALHELAAKAADLTGRSEREVFDVLMQHEKLGSTGVGSGIAIPHGKLAKLDRLFGLFARLDRAIDFDALDGQPVDLVFVLLAPEAAGADHLKALARVARLLRDPDVANKLRDAHASEAIPAVLAMPSQLPQLPQSSLDCHDRNIEMAGTSPAMTNPYDELRLSESRLLDGYTVARSTLTFFSWFSHAFRSRLRACASVSMIGVPSAASNANRLRPGAISGACGNKAATSCNESSTNRRCDHRQVVQTLRVTFPDALNFFVVFVMACTLVLTNPCLPSYQASSKRLGAASFF